MASNDPTVIPEERAARIVSACRTTVGDELRSVTYFTADAFEQLYLRSDLAAEADLAGFVEHETAGFRAHAAYRRSELGEYRFTIRVFEHGFLVRVTTDDEGVFLTTDGLTIRDFREVATALRELLAR